MTAETSEREPATATATATAMAMDGAVRACGPTAVGPGRAEPIVAFARGPVLLIAAATVALMVAGSARYGYHRDELYYLWGGEHLDWGFVDHPPLVPALARVLDILGGGSLVPLRLAAALVVGWLAVAGAQIARELGGGRQAQVLAAFAVAATPATRAPELLFGTTAFDAAVWAAVLLLVTRLLRTGSTRQWVAIGVVVGVGLETKWSVLALVGALGLALLASERRRLLGSWWLVLGAAITALAWLPNLWWNAANGWPALEFQASVAEEYGALDQRLLFVPMQLLLTGLVSVVVWGPGLVGLVRGTLGRQFRPLGTGAIILVVAVLASGGKPYYVAPYYVALFAAGAVVVERAGRARLRSAAIVLAVMAVVSIPATSPVLPPSALPAVEPINAELGEMVGWPSFVEQVEQVHGALPDDERATAVVITANYGEAGALARMAPDLPVRSAHNSLWSEGPPPDSATTAVLVGLRRPAAERLCGSLTEAAVIENDAAEANDEHGRSIFVCRELTAPWPELWERMRHYD